MLLGIPGTLIGTVASAFYCGMGRCEEPVINPVIEPATTCLEASISADTNDCSNRTVSVSPLTPTQANVLLNVPFTSQAPFNDWSVPYDEACEEASLIMLEHFLTGVPLNNQIAKDEINEIVNWQTAQGYGVDISAQQIADIAARYYGLGAEVYAGDSVTGDNIKKLLSEGHPIIIPVAGKDLNNPNFRGAGPPYHVIVIIGYDDTNFITHDPGTRNGASYKYPQGVIINAIHDWNGSKNTVKEGQKAMVVITKDVPQRF